MTCEVTIAEGTLAGCECTAYDGLKYYSFEGIPYAKPPVGKLRFRDPQPVDSWSGVRDATKPGNKCAQIDPYGKRKIEGSEDCLYLNVYTPCLPADKLEKLPVLFFVHGGRFLIGYGHYYRPDYLIRHNVVLVTINYRLNILGFLCLNIPEVPGNAAMKDTIMALRWVKRNIHHFNGEENNVTAFGESAGAGIVTSYLTSKMADGLIHKIICQSGVSVSDLFITDEDPIEKARQVSSYLGQDILDPRKLYESLLNTPLDDLLYALASAELSRPPAVVRALLLPVLEKKFDGVEQFFDDYPMVVMRENRFKKLPILCSLHSHEGALFLRKDEHGRIMFEENFQYFIPRYLYIKPNTIKSLKFANNLRDYYFRGKKVDEATAKEYVNLVSDHYFARDILLFSELVSKYNKDLYLCRFAFGGNLNIRTMKNLDMKGASHGDLLQYLFYRSTKAGKCNEKDTMVINAITEFWCNFARSGKPMWSQQQFEWLAYSKEDRLCLNIDDDGLKLKTYPNFDRLKFWYNLMGDRSKI
ncbi:esterase FE4-like [Aricia agestis]|uniref:esterase FE4-like n=1 Tax=Aricia agestis TaxID=91739 RepID=UPI001C202610|nr:esterase FE4-like [Aricia agestis]